MIYRIIIIPLLITFLNQCGYQTIYSDQNINFHISEILIQGDLEIGRQIKRRLSSFEKTKKSGEIFKIKVNSVVDKKISSKDKEGNPKTFTLSVVITMTTIDQNNSEENITFSESINYNNDNDKFSLKRYENSSQENLTENIIEDILAYLQNISSQTKSNAILTGSIGFTNKSIKNDN